VDYGTGPMVRDPHSGKYRRTRLFVLTLGSAANRFVCWCSGPVRKPGLSCTSERSAGWAERRVSSCSTTLAPRDHKSARNWKLENEENETVATEQAPMARNRRNHSQEHSISALR